jgi:hypothetical protein
MWKFEPRETAAEKFHILALLLNADNTWAFGKRKRNTVKSGDLDRQLDLGSSA